MNVTATISDGANAPLATCQAIRRVIVVVLPVPAPAEDADRPARRLDGGALLVVQSGEDLLGIHGSPTVPGGSAGFVTRACRIQP